jgi:hypothetical protein
MPTDCRRNWAAIAPQLPYRPPVTKLEPEAQKKNGTKGQKVRVLVGRIGANDAAANLMSESPLQFRCFESSVRQIPRAHAIT